MMRPSLVTKSNLFAASPATQGILQEISTPEQRDTVPPKSHVWTVPHWQSLRFSIPKTQSCNCLQHKCLGFRKTLRRHLSASQLSVGVPESPSENCRHHQPCSEQSTYRHVLYYSGHEGLPWRGGVSPTAYSAQFTQLYTDLMRVGFTWVQSDLQKGKVKLRVPCTFCSSISRFIANGTKAER